MWQQTVRDWTAYLSVTDRADKASREYRRTMLDPFEVTQDAIVAYVAALPKNGSVRSMVLQPFRSFYSWAEDHGQREPGRRLKVPRRKYGDAPFLRETERTAHLQALARREPRRACVYTLIYVTGGRIGSILRRPPGGQSAVAVEFGWAHSPSCERSAARRP